jgi:regulator of cell morphogenesis and NO signaling
MSRTTFRASATVGQIVAESPQLARVFEDLEIDYCCGGKRPLVDVCRERGIDPNAFVVTLADMAAKSPAADATAWNTAPLAALCDDIQHAHHDYLRKELPRLSVIIAKVVKAHGQHHPELAGVEATFTELRAELEPHMMKEECILFPSIRYLETNGRAMQFPFGSLSNPIRVMVSEHDHAGDALARLRKLTRGYEVPLGACNTYRVMLESLAALERDMHLHVHKENNILFPRAAELEARLRGGETALNECGVHCSALATH